jgi:hypothetical protein
MRNAEGGREKMRERRGKQSNISPPKSECVSETLSSFALFGIFLLPYHNRLNL